MAFGSGLLKLSKCWLGALPHVLRALAVGPFVQHSPSWNVDVVGANQRYGAHSASPGVNFVQAAPASGTTSLRKADGSMRAASSMSCWHAPPGMASRQVSSQLRPIKPHTHRCWYLMPSDTQRNVLMTRPVSPSHETEPLPAKPGAQVGKHDVGPRTVKVLYVLSECAV